MDSSVLISESGPQDAERISEVLLKSFRKYESVYTRDGFERTAISADAVRQRMAEGPVWVARTKYLIIGTSAAVIRENSTYYIL